MNMEITPNGRSLTETSFLTKLALDLIEKQNQPEPFDKNNYSLRKTNQHTIQINKIGLVGDLPQGVTDYMWTTPENARKLQRF